VRVTVVCFGAMREYLPDPSSGRAELEIGEGGTVHSVVGALGAPDRLVHSVLLDGLRTELGHEVHDGAEVTLMPRFAGGATS
jgi:molybdopterin converting factor small subunit